MADSVDDVNRAIWVQERPMRFHRFGLDACRWVQPLQALLISTLPGRPLSISCKSRSSLLTRCLDCPIVTAIMRRLL